MFTNDKSTFMVYNSVGDIKLKVIIKKYHDNFSVRCVTRKETFLSTIL